MKRHAVLLLCLALLLPVRGALAGAGILCHVGSSPIDAVAGEVVHHPDAMPSGQGSHAHDDQHRHSTGHDAPGQSDTCKYCTAVCSVPPIAPADQTFQGPEVTGGERFAALQVLALSPVEGGLERPPRTI